MDSAIAAALISALSSIIVAAISRTGTKPGGDGSPDLTIPSRHSSAWKIGSIGFIVVTAMAAMLAHHDLAGLSVLVLPVLVLVLSLAYPIRPASAAAVTLFLFPFAYLAEPLGKWRRDMRFDNHFDSEWMSIFLAIAFGTAFVVWLINLYRTRRFQQAVAEPEHTPPSSALARQIAELAELHQQGILSDEEFAKGKDKLLSL